MCSKFASMFSICLSMLLSILLVDVQYRFHHVAEHLSCRSRLMFAAHDVKHFSYECRGKRQALFVFGCHVSVLHLFATSDHQVCSEFYQL